MGTFFLPFAEQNPRKFCPLISPDIKNHRIHQNQFLLSLHSLRKVCNIQQKEKMFAKIPLISEKQINQKYFNIEQKMKFTQCSNFSVFLHWCVDPHLQKLWQQTLGPDQPLQCYHASYLDY